MKFLSRRTLTVISITFLSLFGSSSYAQTIILSEYFTTYGGIASTVPTDWVFNYNSHYNSVFGTGASGPSGPNSYKFGADNATIISPQFQNGDSVRFYIKGNGIDSLSALLVYQGTDTTTMTLVSMIKPLPVANGFISLPISQSSKYLKFKYSKSVGNCSFDDFEVVRNSTVGVNTLDKKQVLIYPNPATNNVTVNIGQSQSTDIALFNMIGKKMEDISIFISGNGIYNMNLNSISAGTYFVQIKTETGVTTRRLQVVK